jgi:hypothetical protein
MRTDNLRNMRTTDLSEEDRQLLEYAEKVYEGWQTDLNASARVLVAANLIALALADADWPDLMANSFCAGLARRVDDVRRRREGPIQ